MKLVKVKLGNLEILQPVNSLVETFDIFHRLIFNAKYTILPDDVIIDVGSHVGIFTLKASKEARNGLVISVEPYGPSFNVLKQNITNNKLSNVQIINTALSDTTGTTKLYIENSSLDHSIVHKSDRFIEVSMDTIDSLVSKLDLTEVNFIKINTEGAELDILEGATKTLTTNSNIALAVAANHYPNQEKDVSDFLVRFGFQVKSQNRYVYGKRLSKKG